MIKENNVMFNKLINKNDLKYDLKYNLLFLFIKFQTSVIY